MLLSLHDSVMYKSYNRNFGNYAKKKKIKSVEQGRDCHWLYEIVSGHQVDLKIRNNGFSVIMVNA